MSLAQEERAQDPRKARKLPRQLLSCTKCRERKVKVSFAASRPTSRSILLKYFWQCDRTKPCSACCARGQPRQCHFVVGEDSDYYPIQQSYEIRKLRAENLQLKERLHRGKQAPLDSEKPIALESPGFVADHRSLKYESQSRPATSSDAFDANRPASSTLGSAHGQVHPLSSRARSLTDPSFSSHQLRMERGLSTTPRQEVMEGGRTGLLGDILSQRSGLPTIRVVFPLCSTVSQTERNFCKFWRRLDPLPLTYFSHRLPMKSSPPLLRAF